MGAGDRRGRESGAVVLPPLPQPQEVDPRAEVPPAREVLDGLADEFVAHHEVVLAGLAVGQEGLGVGEVAADLLAVDASAPLGEEGGQGLLGFAAGGDVLGVNVGG